MAVRLTVVISQGRQGSSKQQMLEAGLIAELIGRPGIDVSLIGPLSQVEQSATDRLVLEGISGDFAIVAWQSADQSIEELETLQIRGRRSAHRADPHAETESGRRIYCFDGSRFSTAEELAESLEQLLNERRVVTVSLVPPTSRSPAGSLSRRAALPSAEGGSAGAASDPLPKLEADRAAGSAASDTEADPVMPPAAEREGKRERAADARLDALVDDLNRFDL